MLECEGEKRVTHGSGKPGFGKTLKTGAALFAGAAVAIAAAGQAIAWRRDKHGKPSLDSIIDGTSEQAQ